MSFGLRSEKFLYGFEILMYASVEKQFRMLVGPIKDGFIEGFGVERGKNARHKYYHAGTHRSKHYYKADTQTKYATMYMMTNGLSLFNDLTFRDETNQFCSEVKEQTEDKVQTFTDFCGRFDDGSYVNRRSFVQT